MAENLVIEPPDFERVRREAGVQTADALRLLWRVANQLFLDQLRMTRRAVRSQVVTVPNLGVASLGGDERAGLLAVAAVEDGAGALYHLRGTGHGTDEVSDPAGLYTPTAGTENQVNLYYSATNARYELENRRGGTRTVTLTWLGA